MEIVFYPSSGSAIPLTGESSDEGMQGGDAESRNLIDFPPVVDGDGVEARDMGNTQKQLSFAIERTWDTPGEASTYWLQHLSAFDSRPTGRLRMRSMDTSGNVISEQWLEGAGIVSVRGIFEGCMTRFQYQIGGGLLTTPT